MAVASPRLLVLACSSRKHPEPSPLPAIQRYDGPAFRVVRKYLRAAPTTSLHTFVLSAEFGLIAGSMPIPLYERRMTRKRAEELRPRVTATFAHLYGQETYTDVLLCMGKDYLDAVGGLELLVASGSQVLRTSGSIGRHLSELHAWLRKDSPEVTMLPLSPRGRAVIQGIELALTAPEVMSVARAGIAQAGAAARRYQSWYVPVGNERVAPKWLVSHLTGLPVSTFRTADAKRVLSELGIEVRRA